MPDRESNAEVLRRVSFDAYDFLAYLIPGGVFTVGFVVLCKFVPDSRATAVLRWIKSIFTTPLIIETYIKLPLGAITVPIVLTIILIMIYCIGHLVASISALVIDKMYIEKCHGYPYERLLFGSRHPTLKIKERFGRGMMSLTVNSLLFTVVSLALPTNWRWVTSASLWFFLWTIEITLITKFLLYSWHKLSRESTPASGHSFIRSFIYGHPNTQMMRAWETVCLRVGFLGSASEWPMGTVLRLFRIRRAFPANLQSRILKGLHDRFDVHPEEIGTEVYWLTYLDVTSTVPESEKTLRHFLRLYGFARNLSACFILLAALAAYFRWKHHLSDNFTAGFIKRRGMAAVDEALARGPVHVVRSNKPQYVVLSEAEYEALLSDLAEARLARSEADLTAGRVRRGTAAKLMAELRKRK